MNEPITLPAPREVAERIRYLKAELTRLERLHRIATAAANYQRDLEREAKPPAQPR